MRNASPLCDKSVLRDLSPCGGYNDSAGLWGRGYLSVVLVNNSCGIPDDCSGAKIVTHKAKCFPFQVLAAEWWLLLAIPTNRVSTA